MQAILSQFTRSKKNTDTTCTSEFDDDDDDTFKFEEDDDDGDLETDTAREESDDCLIATIANEIDIVKDLTAAETDLGCYAMSKVSLFL